MPGTNLSDIHIRLKRGDHVNDNELEWMINKLCVIEYWLSELNCPEYRLVHVDVCSTLDMCRSYLKARKARRS
jgi:hypothetical protein